MIYAVPLTSLSPSSFLSALTPLSLLLTLTLSPPLRPSHLLFASLALISSISASSPQSSLSNGDKGRPSDYLSNGKKRKADEKEFMTDYVSITLS